MTVAYIVSSELISASSQLPSNLNRSKLVHSLVSSFGLLKKVRPVRPTPASREALAEYHSGDYLDVLLRTPPEPSALHGLDHDNPVFPALSVYATLVAGAALTAVKTLGVVDIAIAWDGGRHHAQKSTASGYCYVADCILAILAIRRVKELDAPRSRVMYIDLDLHFSDAVSQAFYRQSSVMTLSIHHTAPGFYPPSPLATLQHPDQPGFDPFALSIPLQRGASANTYARIWPLVQKAIQIFSPSHMVIQCGVDALAGDPHAVMNWSLPARQDGSLGYYIQHLLHDFPGKKVLLGGGGYNSPNAARAWAYLTSIAVEEPLADDVDIPLDHLFFPLYAPSFTLDIPKGNMQDQNTPEYLTSLLQTFEDVIFPALQASLPLSTKIS
ncbi:Arginase/deacetylase [Cylindrobasidium torrendii FP15055 ss-10]|uniref:histone deacetylase n=1 Tax=Cylindrobasidium torrendii FP15055 ss-10 TaxID=1314674 RepID=A0A0D7BLT8_9AGAR|nr:Arginase/deacetylase [Cylindrobasidium torrendii FP15055 ss-10]